MKKTLFIIPMLAPMTVMANLPDEINYEPYKLQYEQLSADLEIVTSNLNQARANLEASQQKEIQIQNQIQNLQDDNSIAQADIDDLTLERQDLTATTTELTPIVNDLDARVQRASQRRTVVIANINSEDRRLQPFRRKLNKAIERVQTAKNAVDSANRGYLSAKDIRERVHAETIRLQNSVKADAASLRTKEARLANIESSLADEEKKLTRQSGKLKDAKAAKKAADTKLADLKQKSADLRAKLAEVAREHGPRSEQALAVRQKMVQANRKVSEQNKVVQTAAAEVTKFNNRVNSTNKEITKLKADKTKLPREIRVLTLNLEKNRPLLRTRREDLKTANANMQSREATLNSAVINEEKAEAAKTDAEIVLKRESRELHRLESRLSQIDERIRTLGEELRINSNALNAALDRLDVIDNTIPVLRNRIANNRRSINNLDNDLILVQDQIVAYNNSVLDLESEESSVSKSRDRKYQEYISRQEYYSQKLQEAKSLGANQTDAAFSIAKQDSNDYVSMRSNNLGSQVGMSLAQAQAAYWSTIRAEIKGYNDGYDIGYASEAEQGRGISEGSAAGRQAAIDYANTTLKPQFFNQIFAAKLESQNLSFNPLAQATAEEIERIEAKEKELKDLLAVIKPVSAQEVMQSLKINTSLDAQINTMKSNLSEVVAQKDTTSNPESVYETPSQIPFTEVQCDGVYKNVAEFKKACETEFYDVFESSYKSEYFANFKSQYKSLFEQKVEDVVTNNIESLYESGYKISYPVAKEKGTSDGEKEIYRQAYARAYDNGYNQQIPSATNAARGEANQEVNTYIANNATLTLKGSSIENTDFMGGSAAKIKLKLKNISPKSLTSPVMVKITDTRNAYFSQKEFTINHAPGNQTIDFNQIDFAIDNRARSGQPIKVEGEVILNGGLYNARRVEKFTVNAVTATNPAVNTSVEYDRTPRVVTRFRNRTVLHNVNINIAPKVENLPEGYTINISALPATAQYVQNLNNRSIRTGSLREGRNTQVSFSYTLWLAGRGKNVKFQLDYIFKGKKIKSEIMTVVPQ